MEYGSHSELKTNDTKNLKLCAKQINNNYGKLKQKHSIQDSLADFILCNRYHIAIALQSA